MRTDYHSDVMAKHETQPMPAGSRIGGIATPPHMTIRQREAQLMWTCFGYAMDLHRGHDAPAHRVTEAAKHFYEHFRPFMAEG